MGIGMIWRFEPLGLFSSTVSSFDFQRKIENCIRPFFHYNTLFNVELVITLSYTSQPPTVAAGPSFVHEWWSRNVCEEWQFRGLQTTKTHKNNHYIMQKQSS